MDDASHKHLLEILAVQRQKFANTVPQRMESIDLAWQQVLDRPNDLDCQWELYRLVHSLAGSAGSFGYDSLGRSAQALELILQTTIENTSWFESTRGEIGMKVHELNLEAERSCITQLD